MAPVATSPEAVHQGRTWDHRAADLCINHVLTSQRQTETALTQEMLGWRNILVFIFYRDVEGIEMTGMGYGLNEDIITAHHSFIPATWLPVPSVISRKWF